MFSTPPLPAHSLPAAILRLLDASAKIEKKAWRLDSIEAIDASAREEAIALAREILEKLKLQGGDDWDEENLLDPARKAAVEAEAALDAVEDFEHFARLAEAGDAEALVHTALMEAQGATCSLAYLLKIQAIQSLRDLKRAELSLLIAQMERDLAQMPGHWKPAAGVTVKGLVAQIRNALDIKSRDEKDDVHALDLLAQGIAAPAEGMDNAQAPQQAQAQAQTQAQAQNALAMNQDYLAARARRSEQKETGAQQSRHQGRSERHARQQQQPRQQQAAAALNALPASSLNGIKDLNNIRQMFDTAVKTGMAGVKPGTPVVGKNRPGDLQKMGQQGAVKPPKDPRLDDPNNPSPNGPPRPRGAMGR